MTEPDMEKQLSDAVIVSAGMASGDTVIFHTASKMDAEFLYSAVDTVAVDREIRKTGQDGLHREYYLELAESDEHSLDSEDEFEWNTRPVWQVKFTPTEFCHQRMLNWADENTSIKAPHDFRMTPTIAEVIYRAGAHELCGGDGEPYIEFDAANVSKLDAELKNLDIETTSVGSLWRLDPENSAKFRAYAGLPVPSTADAIFGGE